MSLFSRVKGWIAPKNSAVVDSGKIRRGDGVWESFTGGASGAPSEREAMAVTAVYACVSLISGAIAALPMHIYRRSDDGDLERDHGNELWWMLNEQFCPRWTASAGWSFITASRLLHGDGYAEILRSRRDGSIIGLVPIHPNRVRVIATPDGSRLIYEVQPDSTIQVPSLEASRVRVLDQDDVLHVPGFGFNGLNGMSALRNPLRSAGRLAISAQDFSSNFLGNAARPDFALKTAGNIDDDKYAQLQDRLAEHRSPVNAGRPMILEGGLDIKELTMPMEDMQLLETRRFQVEEVARAFNVPPFMIGHTEKTSSWGTGVESMGAGFVRYTLRDHLNAFQNEINRKFFRRPNFCAEFDTAELERGDFKSLAEGVRIGIGRAGEPAVMSVEEGRRMLRLPKKMAGGLPQQPAPGGQT
jgi:HK97 family phage portal protein